MVAFVGRSHAWDRSRGKGMAPTFSPLQLSGLSAWYRADKGVTLNGATVSAWGDQSGNGRHFSQGTAASQPTFAATGLGGQPALTFDGTSDSLATAATVFSTPSSGMKVTLFVVASIVSLATGAVILELSTNTNAVNYGWLLSYGSGKVAFARLDTLGWSNEEVATTAGTPHVLMATLDKTLSALEARIWVDNSNAGTQTLDTDGATPMTTAQPLFLGARGGTASFGALTVAEVIMVGDVLSTKDQNSVARYLGARYGITVA
jgi:hypothetical protein